MKTLEDTPVNEFLQTKLRKEAKKNWDLFYKRNTVNFFKDRHWTDREFTELQDDGNKKILLEVGCGVGNFIFPLLEKNPNLYAYACDFSPRAVDFVKSRQEFDPNRCTAFVCDLIQDNLIDTIAPESVDIISLIFVLSAIPPEKMDNAVKNLAKVMKPGGVLLFRDYGRFDMAQLRFKKGHLLSENFYFRQDGTFSYYFSEDETKKLFQGHGFNIIENEFVEKVVENRKENKVMKRVFLQGKYVKKEVEYKK